MQLACAGQFWLEFRIIVPLYWASARKAIALRDETQPKSMSFFDAAHLFPRYDEMPP
jgi:hypothetical protein